MSNNSNIVKIGSALKWRGTFDLAKKYYQENIVTVCGCVFRCKVAQAIGKTPVKSTDEEGHIGFTNTDVWDVVVDMTYYYNFAIDTKEISIETLEYVDQLDKSIKTQQSEILKIKQDNINQDDEISGIESRLTTVEYDIQTGFDTITDTLDETNTSISSLVANVTSIKKANDSDHALMSERLEEHSTQLSNIDISLMKSADEILHLLSVFSCTYNGIWQNDLKWNNDAIWEESNYEYVSFSKVDDAIHSILNSISRLKTTVIENQSHNEDEFDTFKETYSTLFNDIIDTLVLLLSEHEEYKAQNDDLRVEIDGVKESQIIILANDSFQDKQIDRLLVLNSVVTKGTYNNDNFWVNDSLWVNSQFESLEDKEGLEALSVKHNKDINDINLYAKQTRDNLEEFQLIAKEAFQDQQNRNENYETALAENKTKWDDMANFGENVVTFMTEQRSINADVANMSENIDKLTPQLESMNEDIEKLKKQNIGLITDISEENILQIADIDEIINEIFK